nr:phage terminase large subunit family protein [Wolbachia endosymbiont (group A) of Anomoia purmunda]
MNTLAIDPLLIFWFISFLLSFPIPSNPKSLLFPILSSFLNPEFALKGYTKQEWQKIRDRNEVLDCKVCARAASIALGIDRWPESKWESLAGGKS